MSFRYLVLILFGLLFSLSVFSQKMQITGHVQDTVANKPLQYAVAMVIRFKDSVLVAHTRTDASGHFQFKNLNLDTVQVIISHPLFGDQNFYLFGNSSNHDFDFGKVILPPKSHNLKEVVIYAFKDPVYYRGDTLVYTADSFKTRPNATVEDLLKKLPGIIVDKDGNITAQGKAIDQVLVDGDEFFGSDPTMATKNLAANSIESVQVYEKKNDNSSESGKETSQVMNLKLKEDAKKGYFGKASVAGDGQDFYETDLLANKFKGKQKISLFGLGSNTPYSGLGGEEMYQYGMVNEINFSDGLSDNGDWWTNYNSMNYDGIPKNFKTGFYYTDQITKTTKLLFNYSYNNSEIKSTGTNRSQYFLADTNYTTETATENIQKNIGHTFNLKLVQKIDTFTELEIIPKLTVNSQNSIHDEVTKYFSAADSLTRQTSIDNHSDANGFDLSTTAKLTHKFKKQNRVLTAIYNYRLKDDKQNGFLESVNTYNTGLNLLNDTLNEKKDNASNLQTNNARLFYVEPLNKKNKLEFSYDLNYSKGTQTKNTLDDVNGEYTQNNALFSNDFANTQTNNKVGARFIHEVKKYTWSVGIKARHIVLNSHNLITDTIIKRTDNNLLPSFSYQYRFNDSKLFEFNYNTNYTQPSISQLQPIHDNTNPNQIRLGNPNLIPTYNHDVNLFYYSYKVLTRQYVTATAHYTMIEHAFTNSTVYDNLGRAVSKAINTNGNQIAYFQVSKSLPTVLKIIKFHTTLQANYSKYSYLINADENITRTKSANGNFTMYIQEDKLEVSLSADYTYAQPTSSLSTQNNTPYSTQKYQSYIRVTLPHKFRVDLDANYNINNRRTVGYNIDYFLLNAMISKSFMKTENLVLSLHANDVLNQNINAQRIVQDNMITDTKTNIIGRYILLKLTYKFNSTKTKYDDSF